MCYINLLNQYNKKQTQPNNSMNNNLTYALSFVVRLLQTDKAQLEWVKLKQVKVEEKNKTFCFFFVLCFLSFFGRTPAVVQSL